MTSFLMAISLLQGVPTNPGEVLKPLLRDSVVQARLDGDIWRITVTHEEARGGGGQTAQSPLNETRTPPTKITFTEQFVAIPTDHEPNSTADLKWLPRQEDFPRIATDMGLGKGYHWFGNATYDVLRTVSRGLGLIDGESPFKVAIRALDIYDYRNAPSAAEFLVSQGDASVEPLKLAAPTEFNAINILCQIRTPKAVDALLDLHTKPELKSSVEVAFAPGKPVESARAIYADGLSQEDAAASCARVAVQFGWLDLEPAIRSAYAKTTSPFVALELLDSLHRLGSGTSLPSFEKVHNYFEHWTSHDDRAILAAKDPNYAPLCVAKMISLRTKRGSPLADVGVRLANMLKATGRGGDLDTVLRKFQMTQRLEDVRKELVAGKG